MTRQETTCATEIEFGASLRGTLEGKPSVGAALVSHGAGGNKNTPLLVRTCQRLNELGFLTLRWDFGYINSGGAPSAGGKREIPEMSQAIECLQDRAGDLPLVLIGKSFGARVSTYLAQDRDDIAGFVFYGLPLVGMGKNAKPRDWSHLGRLPGKILFVTGDKDKLCPLDELRKAQSLMSNPFSSQVVPGDHSFKPRGEDAALNACIDWIKQNFTW
jgi:predicted alpha/beta-hydrolase family hydrolase